MIAEVHASASCLRSALKIADGRCHDEFKLARESKVQAEFKEGVLSVHLVKSAKAAPKAIEVKVA